MNQLNINEKLKEFQNQLYDLKVHLEQDLLNLEDQEREFEVMNNLSADSILAYLPEYINISIGGEIYSTSSSNILNYKDSLFYYMLIKLDLSGLIENNFTLYFERKQKNFDQILNFIRYRKCKLSLLTKNELISLKEDSEFYGLYELTEYIESKLSPEIIEYTCNGPYFVNYGYDMIGEIDVNAIKEKNDRGLTTASPAWICFELKKVVEFDSIIVRGFCGNSNFSSNNGSGSSIKTSIDGVIFKDVGKLNSIDQNYNLIKVEKSLAKFIKLTSTGNIGFSFFEVQPLKK